MATFTLNINAQEVAEYVVTANKLFLTDDCAANVPYDQETAIGLIQDTATINPPYFLLSSYTDASSWKTLKFRNIVYSNPLNVYLSDTLVKIPEAGATVYDFDVTGQATDIAIPNLTLTYDNYTPVATATITFELAVENLLNEVGPYQPVTIQINYKACPAPAGDDLVINNIANDGCTIEDIVNVIVPTEGERYVIVTANDIYGNGSDLTAGTTITTDTPYQMIIDAATSASPPTIYSNVLLRAYNNSTQSVLIDSHQITRNHTGNVC